MFLNFTLKFYAWFNSTHIFLFKVMVILSLYAFILSQNSNVNAHVHRSLYLFAHMVYYVWTTGVSGF